MNTRQALYPELCPQHKRLLLNKIFHVYSPSSLFVILPGDEARPQEVPSITYSKDSHFYCASQYLFLD